MTKQPAIEQRISRLVDDFAEDIADAFGGDLDRHPQDSFINQAKAELLTIVNEAVVAAIVELRRRWHDDRKTMDYVPATYDYICDKYIAELTTRKDKAE